MNNYNPNIHHRRSIRLQGYDYSQAGLYFITICCNDRERRFGKIENNEMVLNEFGIAAYNEWAKLPARFPNFELDVFQIMPNHMHGIIALVGATLAVAQNGNDVNAKMQNGQPQSIIAQPQSITGQPQSIIAQPQSITGQPQSIIGQPQSITGQPQSIIPQPQSITGQPQSIIGQPQGLPQPSTDYDNRAGVNPAPTIGNIVGAYKSLVANTCLEIFKSKNERMGKLWQRNYYECIIRNEQSYQTISKYIINNPRKWKDDKFYNQ